MSLERGVSWKARLRLKVFCVFIVSAFCVLGFMQKESSAFSISGAGAWGEFSGTIEYNAGSSLLEVFLENTSHPLNGGFLSAFALGTDPGLTAIPGLFSSTDGGFFNIPPAISVGSENRYIGATASTTSSEWWLGGGSPTVGLGVGQSASFDFTLTGNTDGLTEQVIQDAMTADPDFFLVRFRGFANEESDKVPGTPRPPQIQRPIPEPTTVLLLGIGLVGLAGAEARRRRKKKAVDKS